MNQYDPQRLREFFWQFAERDRWTGGPDTHLAMIAEMNQAHEFIDQAWLAGCYVAPYNVTTGYRIYEAWPVERMRTGAEGLEAWLTEHWAGLSVRTERRAVRTPQKLSRHLLSYFQWADNVLPTLVGQHWEPAYAYRAVWDSAKENVWGAGRYALLKLLETFERTGWEIAIPDIRPVGGDSPRKMLATLYDPDLATGNDAETLDKIAACVDHLRAEGEARGVSLSMFNTEVYLCEFLQAMKKNQYPGRALDSELGHYRKVSDDFGEWPEFFELRERMFPEWALGEKQGWTGRRKELGECLPIHGYMWSDRLYDYKATEEPARPVEKVQALPAI